MLVALLWSVTALASPDLATHDGKAGPTLIEAWTDPTWWDDAWKKTFDGELFDEIRLKPVEHGYIPMITGESDEDIPSAVVADCIFLQMIRLPEFMEGAKSVVTLGAGYDATVGAPYRDNYFFIDLGLFYMTWAQRGYRKVDGDRSFLWYEKLDPSFVDAVTWEKYQAKIAEINGNVDKRWALNAVVPVGAIFGMFVVEPGKHKESRVTLISRLEFDDTAGWVAQWGSQLPQVLRSGLKSGFSACVAICKNERDRRKKAAPPDAIVPAAPAPAPVAPAPAPTTPAPSPTPAPAPAPAG